MLQPRWGTKQSLDRPSFGVDIARIADALGTPFMPWQRYVADVGGEVVLDDDSGFWLPAYPEVMGSVPRQQGKTTEVLAWILQRLLLWVRLPQVAAYSAQAGSEARKKFRRDFVPALKASPLWGSVTKVRYAADDTSLDIKTGSRLDVWNNSESSGHGSTVDLGVLDELFDDVDDRREQALLPAQATRPDRQKLLTSTAGTERAVVFNRKQATGRAAVEAGRRSGMAYFEWSASPGQDPEDPATWRGCMPALGITISERTIWAAIEEMRGEDGDLSEFSRAFLNISKRSRRDDAEIPVEVWQAVCSFDVQVGDGLVFAVDGTPDRSSASIAAADAAGHVELVEYRPGAGWLAGRAVELARRWKAPVAVDVRGPVGDVAAKLTEAGVEVVEYGTADYVRACGAIWDLIVDGGLSVRKHEAFDAAVKAARKARAGDAWRWSRRDITDISPLVALTLAVDAAARQPAPRIPLMRVT